MSKKNLDVSLTPDEVARVREVLQRMREVQSDTGHGQITITILHKKVRFIDVVKKIKTEENNSENK